MKVTLQVVVADLPYLENIVEDTTPQLGGDLDANSHNISGIGGTLTVASGSITDSTGVISFGDEQLETTSQYSLFGGDTVVAPNAAFISNANNFIEVIQPTDTGGANIPFPAVVLANNQTGVNKYVGSIFFINSAIGGSSKEIASIFALTDTDTDDGRLSFYTYNSGSATECMRFDRSGNSFIYGSLKVTGNVSPVANNSSNLGADTLRWSIIYGVGLDLSGHAVIYDGLYVQDNIAGYPAASIFNDGNHNSRIGLRIQCGADDGSGDNDMIQCFDGDGGAAGNIEYDDGVLQFEQPSDERLKKNIKDYTDSALDIIAGIPVHTYALIHHKDENIHVGFVAQEVMVKFPQSVKLKRTIYDEKIAPIPQRIANLSKQKSSAVIRDEIVEDKRIIETETYSLGGVWQIPPVPQMWKAIQELQKRIEVLEKSERI